MAFFVNTDAGCAWLIEDTCWRVVNAGHEIRRRNRTFGEVSAPIGRAGRQHYVLALPADEHFAPLELKVFRQTNRLTAIVEKDFCCAFHDGAPKVACICISICHVWRVSMHRHLIFGRRFREVNNQTPTLARLTGHLCPERPAEWRSACLRQIQSCHFARSGKSAFSNLPFLYTEMKQISHPIRPGSK